MKKIVGLVCEGPRDMDLLVSVIDRILPQADISYRYIQPDETLSSPFLTGWKGVWNWCDQYGKSIDEYANGISPKLDLLIVHLDGDVSRSNRESHCWCNAVACADRGAVFPTRCDNTKCPIRLPCPHHEETVESYVNHLQALLAGMFSEDRSLPILFFVPCDSTDAWIVAALEDFPEPTDYESIKNPWATIICQGKYYHGVRINGAKKSRRSYDDLIAMMIGSWDKTVLRCKQAARFQEKIVHLFGNNDRGA